MADASPKLIETDIYVVGTNIGGVAARWIFGALLMIAAAAVEARWGLNAERRSLESVARPLSARD